MQPIIIWSAITLSIIVLFAVAYVIGKNHGANSEEPLLLGTLFMIIATVEASTSLGLFFFFTSDSFFKKRLTDATPDSQSESPESSENGEVLPEEARALNLPLKLFPPLIICWALNESIAILGFVHAHQTRDIEPMIPFAAGALILQLLMFPRMKNYVERAHKLSRNMVAS